MQSVPLYKLLMENKKMSSILLKKRGVPYKWTKISHIRKVHA